MDSWAKAIDISNEEAPLLLVIDTILNEYPNANKPAEVLYYLGNAYSKLSELERDNSFNWYQQTVKYRTLTKYHLTDAYNKGLNDSLLATRALTNRTNQLYFGQRWVEALNDYENAIAIETHNGIASSAIVKIAINKMKMGSLNSDTTRLLVRQYFPMFLLSEDLTRSIAGFDSFDSIEEELHQLGAYTIQERNYKTQKSNLDKYEQFCFDTKLYLTAYLPREFYDLNKSDAIELAIYIQGDSKVDESSAKQLFSEIKNSFIVARFNAFQYFTLENCTTHFLLASQKLAFDILDKIAVAIYSILSKKHSKIDSVYFSTIWFENETVSTCETCKTCKTCKTKKKVLNFEKLPPLFKTEILKGNYGLVALIELSYDLFFRVEGEDGKFAYLSGKHKLRNSVTHKFISTNTNSLKAFAVIDRKELEKEVLETLFMVKSAIIYFVEFIYWRNTHIQDSKDNE